MHDRQVYVMSFSHEAHLKFKQSTKHDPNSLHSLDPHSLLAA